MNNREMAWKKRKGLKEPETIQERMKKMKFNDPWSKKGIAEREAFSKKYGRAWWLFTENNSVIKHKDQWIYQYWKMEDNSNE
jgi:hypothetical protein|tara:strand:- start:951 stop:1196 length:246 start_codon:yes stop_codon:yes gene_type:complete